MPMCIPNWIVSDWESLFYHKMHCFGVDGIRQVQTGPNIVNGQMIWPEIFIKCKLKHVQLISIAQTSDGRQH